MVAELSGVVVVLLCSCALDNADIAKEPFDILSVHVFEYRCLELHELLLVELDGAFGGEVVVDGLFLFFGGCRAELAEFVFPHGANFLEAAPVTERIHSRLEVSRFDIVNRLEKNIVDAFQIFEGSSRGELHAVFEKIEAYREAVEMLSFVRIAGEKRLGIDGELEIGVDIRLRGEFAPGFVVDDFVAICGFVDAIDDAFHGVRGAIRVGDLYLKGTLERDDGELCRVIVLGIAANHVDAGGKGGALFVRIVIDRIVPIFGKVIERVFERGREERRFVEELQR